jgi:hypothetical protein
VDVRRPPGRCVRGGAGHRLLEERGAETGEPLQDRLGAA